jgi:hypothetical protein
MAGLTLGWSGLLMKAPPNLDTTDYSKDEVDVFYAVVPVKLDGMQLTPFCLYGRSGKYVFDNDRRQKCQLVLGRPERQSDHV